MTLMSIPFTVPKRPVSHQEILWLALNAHFSRVLKFDRAFQKIFDSTFIEMFKL